MPSANTFASGLDPNLPSCHIHCRSYCGVAVERWCITETMRHPERESQWGCTSCFHDTTETLDGREGKGFD